MNLSFTADNSQQLSGEFIIRMVQRADLTPVPRTIDLAVRDTQGMWDKFAVGSVFWAGVENQKYQVMKRSRNKASGYVQGAEQMATIKVHAYLDSCAQIGYRRATAVIKENVTFGEVFRACGATASVGNDFPVGRFTCFTGQIPSFEITRALQEESGVLVLRKGQLSMLRITDLLKQKPVATMAADTDNSIDSEFMERHEIPSFYSLDDSGNQVLGDFSVTRAIAFDPWSDTRTLNNESRVLVTRKVVNSTLASNILAGDCIQVGADLFAVITVANVFEQSGGVTESYSRLWVGDLST